MRHYDFLAYEENFPKWAAQIDEKVDSIAVLSGDTDQVLMLRKIFPGACVQNLDRSMWDLNRKGTATYDLIVAQNVFMAALIPELWLKHVLEKCRYFWLQDLIIGRRAPHLSYNRQLQECALETGDVMRYQLLPDRPAVVPFAYDLNHLGNRLIDFVAYRPTDESAPENVRGKNFLAFIRGDLSKEDMLKW